MFTFPKGTGSESGSHPPECPAFTKGNVSSLEYGTHKRGPNMLQPYDEWAEAHGLTMSVEPATHNPSASWEGSDDASHWRVTLTGPHGPMELFYTMGSAYRVWRKAWGSLDYGTRQWVEPFNPKAGERVGHLALSAKGEAKKAVMKASEPIAPDIGDVLYSLAMDAMGVTDVYSFEEWAENYGYDTDSRKAEATYKLVSSQTSNLALCLGHSLMTELLELEEGEESPWPTEADIIERFNSEVRPMVLEAYGPDDIPAMREAWNNWTDMLCKDGQITEHQYDTWEGPND